MGSLKRTIKEQEFIRAYIDCKGNAGKAYLQVFPHVKKSSAHELGSRLLKKINLPMAELLDLIGVDDKALSEKLQAGLNATKETGTGKNKKTTPNYYVVARYLDMAYRLKAKYPVDQSRLEVTGPAGGAISITLREEPEPTIKIVLFSYLFFKSHICIYLFVL